MWDKTQASRVFPKVLLPVSHLISPILPYGTFSLFLWCWGLKAVSCYTVSYRDHSGCKACTVIAFTQWVVKKPSAFCFFRSWGLPCLYKAFCKGPGSRYYMLTGCGHWDTMNKWSKIIFEIDASYNLILTTSAIYTSKEDTELVVHRYIKPPFPVHVM